MIKYDPSKSSFIYTNCYARSDYKGLNEWDRIAVKGLRKRAANSIRSYRYDPSDSSALFDLRRADKQKALAKAISKHPKLYNNYKSKLAKTGMDEEDIISHILYKSNKLPSRLIKTRPSTNKFTPKNVSRPTVKMVALARGGYATYYD